MAHSEEIHFVITRRMRSIRAKRGWSKAELAERAQTFGLRWDYNDVAHLESDPPRRKLSVEELVLLPVVLDVELADLIGRGRVSLERGKVDAEMSGGVVLKLLGGRATQVRDRDIRRHQKDEAARG